MEPLHAAPAGRRFGLILVAGFFPEIVVLTVENDQRLVGECVLKRTGSAIEFVPQVFSEFIADHSKRGDVPFDRQNFMLIERHRCTFECQGNLPIEQQPDTVETAVMGSRALGDALECLSRQAVKADLNSMGT